MSETHDMSADFVRQVSRPEDGRHHSTAVSVP